MAMKIYVANLGKYNEGELVGQWLDLPATEEEINEMFVNIELGRFTAEGDYKHGTEQNGVYYEEWAIHDHEGFGFEVSEYSSIKKLNALAEELEQASGLQELQALLDSSDKWNNEKLGALAVSVFNDLGIDHDIIHDDQVNARIAAMVEEGQEWASIRSYTYNANAADFYHVVDGYENLEPLEWQDVQNELNSYIENLYLGIEG